MKVDLSFYKRDDVCLIARELLGKTLATKVDGNVVRGKIVETEAYSEIERACHGFGKKITPRTEVLFAEGGVAYVYLIYGMYELFNVVTNKEGTGEAVLVRAIEPLENQDLMAERRGFPKGKYSLSSGPGKLSQALDITRRHNKERLNGNTIWIEEGIYINDFEIETSPRIGVDYAGDDAKLPWRFYIKDNPWVSKIR